MDGGQFPPKALDEIRDRISVVEVVQERVPLSRSGRSWKGCCPFHGEKTPSFHVYEDHFHCFGCGAHGDVFSFIRSRDGLSFPDAVRFLADRAGVELPALSREEASAGSERKRLKEILEVATKFYCQQIRTPVAVPAQEYLVSRGLNKDDALKFRLGYAPKGDLLVSHLVKSGVSEAEALSAGLAKRAENGKIRDFFFDRIMFPIMDAAGNVVSFGGRTMNDDVSPKYINGPETSVFKKGRHLYGMSVARKVPGGIKEIIFVEGYLDVIAMHRIGIYGAMAPLGTAVTPEHLEVAWRNAPRLIGLFDGDKAGLAAALKTCNLGLSKIAPGRQLSVAVLTEGEDPDSLIRKGEDGATTVRAALSAAVPAEVFAIRSIEAAADLGTVVGRASLRQSVMDLVGVIEDPATALEMTRFANRRVQEILEPPPGDLAPVPRDMAHVMVGLVLRDPTLLTIREDMFRGLPLQNDIASLRDTVCTWWTNLRGEGKGALANRVAEAGQMQLARECIAAVNEHVELRRECGLAVEPASAFDDIAVKVAAPVWRTRNVPPSHHHDTGASLGVG